MIFNETNQINSQKPIFIARNIDEYLTFCSWVDGKDPNNALQGLEAYKEALHKNCKLSQKEENTLNEINNAVNKGSYLPERTISAYKQFLESVSRKLQSYASELSILGDADWSVNVELSNVKRIYQELNSLTDRNNGLDGLIAKNNNLGLVNSNQQNQSIGYSKRDYNLINSIEVIPIDYNGNIDNRKNHNPLKLLEDMKKPNSDFYLDSVDVKKTSELHAFITSPTRGKFRIKLLHQLQEKMSLDEIKKLCKDENSKEYCRHIHKLLEFGLIDEIKNNSFVRNKLGEEIINTMRALERKISKEAAKKIFNASLDTNSEKLFLILYVRKKDVDLLIKEITFTPSEIKNMGLNVFNSIEFMSSINKLEKAGLLVRKNDGNFHMNPIKSFGFYSYLIDLRKLISHKEVLSNENWN